MSGKSRGLFVAGNWKMNHTPTTARAFFEALASRLDEKLGPSPKRVRAAIFPPMLTLPGLKPSEGVELGAQNLHWEKSGAFTGEASGPMAQELGVKLALVGHSERRQYFGESDETVRKRAESLLEQGFDVMVCVGETRAEREGNLTQAVLEKQLGAIFPSAEAPCAKHASRLSVAYEPVWAIGTGLTATPQQAQEAHALIRRFVAQRTTAELAARLPLLYGGSVTPENAQALLSCPDVDGALVGGASVKPESFLTLLKTAAELLS